MAKTKASQAVANDILLTQSEGFFRRGAHFNSIGNIPFAHPNLDFVIQYGETPEGIDLENMKDYDPAKTLGVPRGKAIEMFGWEGSGKSSLAYRLGGSAQRMGLKVAWIDTENSYSEALAKINGMNSNDVYYANMSNHKKKRKGAIVKEEEDEVGWDGKVKKKNKMTQFAAEDVLDNIVKAMLNDVKLVVVDSVASLVPRAILEGTANKNEIAKLARLMSQQMGKIVQVAADQQALVVFINQLRLQPGVMFGNPETTPGGKALAFASSLRLHIHKAAKKVKKGKKSLDSGIYVQDENGKTKLIGRWTKVTIIKSRFAPPTSDHVYIPVYYRPYIVTIEQLSIDFARQVGVVAFKKGVFIWKKHKFNAKVDFVAALKADPVMLQELVDELTAAAEEKGVLLPPEFLQLDLTKKYTVVDPPAKKGKKIEATLAKDAEEPSEEEDEEDDEDEDEDDDEGFVTIDPKDDPEEEDDPASDSEADILDEESFPEVNDDEGSAEGTGTK